MSRMDILSDALNQITMYEKLGKSECVISPVSKLLISVLRKLKDLGYVKDFELVKNNKGGVVRVQLFGRINNCRAIRPRFNVKKNGLESYEKRFLPAYNFGHLILSTPRGVLSHEEAKGEGVGGILLAYVY